MEAEPPLLETSPPVITVSSEQETSVPEDHDPVTVNSDSRTIAGDAITAEVTETSSDNIEQATADLVVAETPESSDGQLEKENAALRSELFTLRRELDEAKSEVKKPRFDSFIFLPGSVVTVRYCFIYVLGQCCGSGMFIPNPDFYSSRIEQQHRKRWEILLSYHFL
jgi:hypothetical protein